MNNKLNILIIILILICLFLSFFYFYLIKKGKEVGEKQEEKNTIIIEDNNQDDMGRGSLEEKVIEEEENPVAINNKVKKNNFKNDGVKILESRDFTASQFFGDFSGNCFEEESCGDEPKIMVSFPEKTYANNVVYSEVSFGEKKNKKALTMEIYDTPNIKNIYFGAPVYPIGNYKAGDKIDYENGYSIDIVSITENCRTYNLKWDVESVEMIGCKDKGLINEPTI